jgi:hypothetical protein
MDTAVALTQAYLHVNGYFTVTEYPVLESMDTKLAESSAEPGSQWIRSSAAQLIAQT